MFASIYYSRLDRMATTHMLATAWAFWLGMPPFDLSITSKGPLFSAHAVSSARRYFHRKPKIKVEDYNSSVKPLGTVHTLEEFWQIYSHIKRLRDLPGITDIHMFIEGTKPVWEVSNANGHPRDRSSNGRIFTGREKHKRWQVDTPHQKGTRGEILGKHGMSGMPYFSSG